MAAQRKSQELDGFVGLENSLLAEMQSHQSPFAMFLLISTWRYVEHVKYLDKQQETGGEDYLFCPIPNGQRAFFIPLVISNGNPLVPVTVHIGQRFAKL